MANVQSVGALCQFSSVVNVPALEREDAYQAKSSPKELDYQTVGQRKGWDRKYFSSAVTAGT